jgi:hypothetical protein
MPEAEITLAADENGTTYRQIGCIDEEAPRSSSRIQPLPLPSRLYRGIKQSIIQNISRKSQNRSWKAVELRTELRPISVN